jgi:hypothetical protein
MSVASWPLTQTTQCDSSAPSQKCHLCTERVDSLALSLPKEYWRFRELSVSFVRGRGNSKQSRPRIHSQRCERSEAGARGVRTDSGRDCAHGGSRGAPAGQPRHPLPLQLWGNHHRLLDDRDQHHGPAGRSMGSHCQGRKLLPIRPTGGFGGHYVGFRCSCCAADLTTTRTSVATPRALWRRRVTETRSSATV